VFIQIYHIRAKHARSFVLYRTALRAKIYHIRAKHARIFVLYRTALKDGRPVVLAQRSKFRAECLQAVAAADVGRTSARSVSRDW
jgi:hypothetical protein